MLGFGLNDRKGLKRCLSEAKGSFGAAFHRISVSLFVVRINLEHCFNT